MLLYSTVVAAICAVFISPVQEEGVKSFIGNLTGGGRMVGALLFGVFEMVVSFFFPTPGLSVLSYVPAFVMHFATGFMTFWPAVVLHTCYNGIVMGAKLWMVWSVFSAGRNPDFGTPFERSSVPPDEFTPWEPSHVCVRDDGPSSALVSPDFLDIIPFSAVHLHSEQLSSFAACCVLAEASPLSSPSGAVPKFYALDNCSNVFGEDEHYTGVFSQDRVFHVYKYHDTALDCMKYGESFQFCPASLSAVPFILGLLGFLGVYTFLRDNHFSVVHIPRVEVDDRLFCAGYRVQEVHLPKSGSHGAKIKLLPAFFAAAPRRSLSSSLGYVFKMFAPCVPDFYHPLTALHGCLCRFCRDPPPSKPGLLRQLRRFSERYVRKHYSPIPSDADVSVENWLAETTYPEWRKEELRRCWKEPDEILPDDFFCKSFIKQESYGKFKPARGINSRSDRFKVFSGPFFKLMEKQIYHQGCLDSEGRLCEGDMCPFIKHVPVPDRPAFLARYFAGSSGPFYETDYSQFEKHFLPDVMQALEMVLYRHMLRNFPRVFSVLEASLSGRNVCKYRGFIIKVFGRRMSGDMCTSLGNGFSNLMLFSFVCWRKGGTSKGIVEGDDGLFISTVRLTVQDFCDLGFDIKICVFEQCNQASFCGMLMSSDGCLMRDPGRVIPKFGWSFSARRNGNKRVRDRLLVAKAMSLAYESPRCPLVWALAKSVLAHHDRISPLFEQGYTEGMVKGWVDKYGTGDLKDRLVGPSLQCRVEYAEKFGISVPLQLKVEQSLLAWDGSTSDDKLLESIFLDAQEMFDFSASYVFRTEKEVGGLCDCLSL